MAEGTKTPIVEFIFAERGSEGIQQKCPF